MAQPTYSYDVSYFGQINVQIRTFSRGTGWVMHDHTFAEAFWIENGECQHTVNGHKETLGAGDLFFLRPSDRHAAVAGDKGFTMVNLATEADVPERLRQAHKVPAAKWPWHTTGQPKRFTLSAKQMSFLRSVADDIPNDDPTTLERDLMVLALVHAVAPPTAQNSLLRLPTWLQRALIGMYEAGHQIEGPADLARHTGYSLDHVNRVVRKALGMTATELINQQRLENAARLLRGHRQSVTEIAFSSGFNNLAHFYRCFHQQYKCTPKKYRDRSRVYV